MNLDKSPKVDEWLGKSGAVGSRIDNHLFTYTLYKWLQFEVASQQLSAKHPDLELFAPI